MKPIAASSSTRAIRAFLLPLILLSSVLLASPALAAEARTIETQYGSVTLKNEPQRVVTLDESALDTALALGIQPVGSVATRGSNKVSEYLQEKAGNISIVGTAREFNFESILALQPDLILAPAGLTQDKYTLMQKLAPTIVPAVTSQTAWQKKVQVYADALDKSGQALQRFTRLDPRIDELKKQLPGELQVSVVRWMPQGPMLMSSEIFTGQVLEALGMKANVLASQLGSRPHSDVLSLENLKKIDGDWLFLATLNEDGESTLNEARKQPAFTRLDAVRNNRVLSVNGQIWTSGTGILAAERILSDIETGLLGR